MGVSLGINSLLLLSSHGSWDLGSLVVSVGVGSVGLIEVNWVGSIDILTQGSVGGLGLLHVISRSEVKLLGPWVDLVRPS